MRISDWSSDVCSSDLKSQIDNRSSEFIANAEHLRGLVAELRQRLARAALGGGDSARDKHTARGKLLPRDRITALLDPGSPFLELCPLAAAGMFDGAAPGAGLTVGDLTRVWEGTGVAGRVDC